MKIIFGGLPAVHQKAIKGAMEFLGYNAIPLPEPDNEALKIGKEYCNRGQCNPTYYTTGNLIKFFKEHGGSDDCVVLTVGSCGPCRFGMYEMEYRKALKEAGFNVPVITFNQSEALNSEFEYCGIKINKDFIVSLIKSIVAGDLVNDIYYKIKPYEVVPGSADKWREKAGEILYEFMRKGRSFEEALREIYRNLSEIEVNFLQPKPKVKIMGEFFAQTTEGDGNYRLAQWLIDEGAEPIVEPVTTWVDYLLWEKERNIRERFFKNRLKFLKEITIVKIFSYYVRYLYNKGRKILGNIPSPLKDQKLMEKYAKDYYNPGLTGGEGHMEVGKHIYMIKHKKAHMVISVKPFGCMPSTQSDGVQAKVIEDLGDTIFISVETSGDAEANFKSRIMMKLYEAKMKALEEYENLKSKVGNIKVVYTKANKKLPERFVTTACNYLSTLHPL